MEGGGSGCGRSGDWKVDGLLLFGLHKEVLEIQERLLGSLHVDKRRRDPRLARTTRTSNLMHVVLRGKVTSVSSWKESRCGGKRTSISFGILKLMTCWISEKSSPFEAMELATMTSFLPVLNALIAYSRSSWAGWSSSHKPLGVVGVPSTKRTFTTVNGHRFDSLEQEVLLNVCTGRGRQAQGILRRPRVGMD